jgi:hypothetical protein
MTQLREYQRTRRRAGASRIRFQGFNFLGLEPNPRLKDATGWRFALGKDGEEPLLFKIWVGSELIQRLKLDGVDVFDALLRAGERLVEDKELRPDRLWLEERVIELAFADRVRLLAAAGRAPDFLLPTEASPEEGVPVMYEMTARDAGSVGEYMPVHRHPEFADVIVDWSAQAGRRLLSTVRLRVPIDGAKAEVVTRALTAYKSDAGDSVRCPACGCAKSRSVSIEDRCGAIALFCELVVKARERRAIEARTMKAELTLHFGQEGPAAETHLGDEEDARALMIVLRKFLAPAEDVYFNRIANIVELAVTDDEMKEANRHNREGWKIVRTARAI